MVGFHICCGAVSSYTGSYDVHICKGEGMPVGDGRWRKLCNIFLKKKKVDTIWVDDDWDRI